MSDIADDDDASDRPQHDDGTTINEAGTPGFAVDGTDSFAVPGPADGLPPLDASAAGAPWRRLLVTLGAAVIVLTLVVVIGTSGRDRGDAGSMRGAETTVPDYTLPSPFGDGDETATTAGDSLDETYSTLAAYDPYGPDDTYTVDTIPPSNDSFDSPPLEIPTYRPHVPPARNVPNVTRPRVTIPRTRTTTRRPAATTTTTTTTVAPADTTTTTTTTMTTTTTTLPAAPVSNWQRPTTALGVLCSDSVRLWAGQHSLLATVGTARAWRSTDGGANWTEVSGLGVPTAYADDPTGGAMAWVATAGGVFDVGSGSRLGDLKNVSSLSAGATGVHTTMIAVADGAVQRSVDGGQNWTSVALPSGAVPGEVLAIDATHVLVGTSAGVMRSIDGAPFESLGTAAVAGSPVRQGATITWLLAAGAGIARSPDDGVHWTAAAVPGIAPAATSLAAAPNGVLLVPGADAKVLSSADEGVTWGPLADQPPYRPDGIVHAGNATVIWTSGCAAATIEPADAIMRLPDS